MKYTKTILEKAVHGSRSVRQVLDKLNLKQAGGNHSYISKLIKDFKIDISHFKGQRWNTGPYHMGGAKKLHHNEVLIFDRRNGRRERLPILRRAMLEHGFEYKCGRCGNEGTWNNEKLVLQIDHLDGDFRNNLPHNLRFLCPNCHSQTSTWCMNKPAYPNGRGAGFRNQ